MADSQIDGNALKAMLGAGVNCVSEHVALINDLNVFPVPDGDTGINLHHTLQRAWREIANREEDAACAVAERFAYGALMGARGNSGTIMSQYLTGFAAGLKQAPVLTAPLLIDACESAVARAYAAVSQPVEGTILTVARESVEDLGVDMPLDEIFVSMAKAAHRSVNNTPNLLPLLKEAGVVDAGGMGLLCFLQGIKQHVCGERAEIPLPAPGEFERPTLQTAPAESYGYDVQFMMMGQRLDVRAVREDMEKLGWSVIVVGDSTAIKVHIHIDNPALPLDYALRAGADLTDVVVENMQLQAIDFAGRQARRTLEDAPPNVSVIAVAEGDGMEAIFRELNCASIIPGGAGCNPSTEAIIGAIERVPGESVIVLPNHKDVLPAAEQAAKLHTGKRVWVAPTTTMMQGVSAMIAYGDASEQAVDFKAMAEAMEAASASVISVQITRATRPAKLNGLNICEDDYIAIVDGAVSGAASDIERTLKDALLLADINGKEIVTLYCGAEFDTAAAKELIESLSMTIKGIEFEAVYGGQALYPLLVSIE